MKWISVNKKMPPNHTGEGDDEGKYLVFMPRLSTWTRYAETYYENGNWGVGEKVSHWAYLPKPPTSYNSRYMVRKAKALLSQIAKATSYIRKRCRTFEGE